jgi:hypothetical protein
MHIARVKCNMGVLVAFQLAPMKQLTLIQLITQPPCEFTLTGQGSRGSLTIGAAGCTLTIRAAKCTPVVGAAGQTLTVGAAGRGLVRAGGVLGVCPPGLCYTLAAQATRNSNLAGKLKCNMYSILNCNMHIARARGLLYVTVLKKYIS